MIVSFKYVAMTLSAFSLAAASVSLVAQEQDIGSVDAAEIIAYQGDVRLTQIEIDAAFSKLPESDRLRFIRDGGAVDRLIRALLQRKTIANDAARAGFDQDLLVSTRMSLEAEKELAEAWLQHLAKEMPPADYEALAREDYLANPDRYRSPEILDVSHILIGTKDRSAQKASSLADSLSIRLAAEPELFDKLVMEYSDDPAKVNNAGRYRDMRRGMMAESFEKAAFALPEPGAISQPVQTEFGWHIIRLNARSGNDLQPFDEVKEGAVGLARQKHLENYRENYLRRILSEPVVIPDGSVDIMARRHFGEDLEKAPGKSQ